MGDADEPLRVFHSPDYTDSNPYQCGLERGLAGESVELVPVSADGLVPLLRAVRDEGRPDVVHLHWLHRFIDVDRPGGPVIATILAARTLLEIAILRLLGIPVVWTVHNVISHERRVPRIERAFRRLAARLVDALVVHCEDARDIVAENYRLRTTDRIAVIPHGSFAPFYAHSIDQTDAREAIDEPTDEPILLFFGLIRRYKRVPELIETFSSLSVSEGRLLVVGNPWNAELRESVEAAAAGVSNVETTLEFVPEDEVPTYLSAADAVVLPYDDILTSGSAILGVTFGRAVIGPRRGCLPSLLGEGGGVTYDPAEPDGLRTALQTALADRTQLRRMGERNQRVADRLTWDRIGRRTAHLYRRLPDER